MKLRYIATTLAAAALLVPVSTMQAQPPRTLDTPYQVHYAANLNHGDTYIDIINTGLNGVPFNGPGIGGFGNATGTGNICLNTYVLTSDEELAACCSCVITPDQVAHLGVNSNLLINTLHGGGGFTTMQATETLQCTAVTQFAGPTGLADISASSMMNPGGTTGNVISCPKFVSTLGTLASAKVEFANSFDQAQTVPPFVNTWTFFWTNVNTDWVPAGFYTDVASGPGLTSTIYTPSVTGRYFPAGAYALTNPTLLANYESPVGGVFFNMATVNTTHTTGSLLLPNSGHLDATAFVTYVYLIQIPSNIPTATVKLVATLPGVNGVPSDCTNSAGMLPTSAIVGGYVATATTLHLGAIANTYDSTETPFIPSQFVTTGGAFANDELHSLGGRCAGILGNGSGFGVCSGCTAGALGASKR